MYLFKEKLKQMMALLTQMLQAGVWTLRADDLAKLRHGVISKPFLILGESLLWVDQP